MEKSTWNGVCNPFNFCNATIFQVKLDIQLENKQTSNQTDWIWTVDSWCLVERSWKKVASEKKMKSLKLEFETQNLNNFPNGFPKHSSVY